MLGITALATLALAQFPGVLGVPAIVPGPPLAAIPQYPSIPAGARDYAEFDFWPGHEKTGWRGYLP